MDSKRFPPPEGHKTGYTIEKYFKIKAPLFQWQQAVVDKCVAGLTLYAAGLAAMGQEAEVQKLDYFISGMANFWDPDVADQQIAAFKRAVAAARYSREAPALSAQGKADILAGLALHAKELRVTDSKLGESADECKSFARALKGQWQADTDSSRQNVTQIILELRGI